jgi:HEAT repeat protein
MAGRILIVAGTVLLASISGHAQIAPPIDADRAAELVQELREFPAALPGIARSDVRPDLREERRRAVYDELWTLGVTAVPALSRGLTDSDVQVRRNVALFLSAAAGDWYDRGRPRLDIRPSLTALIAAVGDDDARVRELVAQAIGAIGSEAAPAVPALIRLLTYPDEGSRNTACIGLRGIGPAAKEALPALRKALSDPSADVRHFAGRAIAAIEAR